MKKEKLIKNEILRKWVKLSKKEKKDVSEFKLVSYADEEDVEDIITPDDGFWVLANGKKNEQVKVEKKY